MSAESRLESTSNRFEVDIELVLLGRVCFRGGGFAWYNDGCCLMSRSSSIRCRLEADSEAVMTLPEVTS